MTQIGMFNDSFYIYQKYFNRFYMQLFSIFTVTNVPLLENTEIILRKFNIKLFYWKLWTDMNHNAC